MKKFLIAIIAVAISSTVFADRVVPHDTRDGTNLFSKQDKELDQKHINKKPEKSKPVGATKACNPLKTNCSFR